MLPVVKVLRVCWKTSVIILRGRLGGERGQFRGGTIVFFQNFYLLLDGRSPLVGIRSMQVGVTDRV